jgi:hypothetical protein
MDNIKILLIDDDEENFLPIIAATKVYKLNYNIIIALSGLEGI